MDPRRLRSEDGTLEALLLRSAPRLEPTASAEKEVWRRLEVLTSAGAAAGATGLAAHAAASAGPQIAGKALWLSWLKWATVLAVGIPVAGVATRLVTHRARTDAVVESPRPPSPTRFLSPPAGPIARPDSLVTAVPAPAASAPKAVVSARTGHVAGRAASSATDAPSELRAEAHLLEAARAKLGAGDFRDALDDVAQLGVDFPRGRLVQEREIVAIDALAALGDRPGLHERARAFLQRFPGSPYAGHVRQLAGP